MFNFRLGHFTSAIIMFLTIVLATGCGSGAPGEEISGEINFGSFDEGTGVYTNDYFNLAIKIPVDWSVMSDKDRAALMQGATDFIAGDDVNLERLLDEQDIQNLVLFVASESPVGAAVETNPSLQVAAENLDGFPGIKTGSDYHFHTKKTLEMSAIEADFKDIYQAEIGGITFDVLESEMTMGSQAIRQKQYAIVREGYALIFAITYITSEDLQKLEDILAQVSFS